MVWQFWRLSCWSTFRHVIYRLLHTGSLSWGSRVGPVELDDSRNQKVAQIIALITSNIINTGRIWLKYISTCHRFSKKFQFCLLQNKSCKQARTFVGCWTSHIFMPRKKFQERESSQPMSLLTMLLNDRFTYPSQTLIIYQQDYMEM